MEKCQCSQCGSTEFSRQGEEFLKCIHCNSLFRMVTPQASKNQPKVIISKGANVTFGSSGKVTIGGQLIIESGANVSFLGKLDVVERSSPEEIANAKNHLKLIRKG